MPHRDRAHRDNIRHLQNVIKPRHNSFKPSREDKLKEMIHRKAFKRDFEEEPMRFSNTSEAFKFLMKTVDWSKAINTITYDNYTYSGILGAVSYLLIAAKYLLREAKYPERIQDFISDFDTLRKKIIEQNKVTITDEVKKGLNVTIDLKDKPLAYYLDNAEKKLKISEYLAANLLKLEACVFPVNHVQQLGVAQQAGAGQQVGRGK